jgi:hypothetical protein
MRTPITWLSFVIVLLITSAWLGSVKAQAGPLTIGLVAKNKKAKTGARKALTGKGHKVQDITREYKEFHGMSSLRTGHLDHKRPGFWPKELNGKWDLGIKACLSQAGKPPYNYGNKLAFLCGQRISRTFWQLYLDHKKFDLVIVIKTNLRRRKGSPAIVTTAYQPDETSYRSIRQEEATRSSVGKDAGKAVLSLLAGDGYSDTRDINRELPEVVKPITNEPDKEYSEAKVREIPAVRVPKGCNPKVVALRVNPVSSPLAKTISKLWVKSVKSLKKSKVMWACSISVTPDSPASADDLTEFTATLKCRNFELKETVLSVSPAACYEGFATGLVTKLLQKFCN